MNAPSSLPSGISAISRWMPSRSKNVVEPPPLTRRPTSTARRAWPYASGSARTDSATRLTPTENERRPPPLSPATAVTTRRTTSWPATLSSPASVGASPTGSSVTTSEEKSTLGMPVAEVAADLPPGRGEPLLPLPPLGAGDRLARGVRVELGGHHHDGTVQPPLERRRRARRRTARRRPGAGTGRGGSRPGTCSRPPRPPARGSSAAPRPRWPAPWPGPRSPRTGPRR